MKIFEATDLGRVCDDLGKETLKNKDECQKAAKELGNSFYGSWHTSSHPKGCFLYYNVLYWNTYHVGRKNAYSQAICKIGGKQH